MESQQRAQVSSILCCGMAAGGAPPQCVELLIEGVGNPKKLIFKGFLHIFGPVGMS